MSGAYLFRSPVAQWGKSWSVTTWKGTRLLRAVSLGETRIDQVMGPVCAHCRIFPERAVNQAPGFTLGLPDWRITGALRTLFAFGPHTRLAKTRSWSLIVMSHSTEPSCSPRSFVWADMTPKVFTRGEN